MQRFFFVPDFNFLSRYLHLWFLLWCSAWNLPSPVKAQDRLDIVAKCTTIFRAVSSSKEVQISWLSIQVQSYIHTTLSPIESIEKSNWTSSFELFEPYTAHWYYLLLLGVLLEPPVDPVLHHGDELFVAEHAVPVGVEDLEDCLDDMTAQLTPSANSHRSSELVWGKKK